MKPSKNKFITLLLVSFLLSFSSAIKSQSVREKIQNYIELHKEKAIEQMVLFKIPASVTMAQAIKESGCGNSLLATSTNNQFGIKCHSEWGGDSFAMNDDTLNECFRKYNSIDDSFYDHSMFLKSRPRYDFLFNLDVTDYFSWCIGLKKAGYATATNYVDELLYIIEVYNLQELDKITPLNNSITYDKLLASVEKNIIEPQENYFSSAEKHILAKVIFNIQTKEEQPLIVRGNTSEKSSN